MHILGGKISTIGSQACYVRIQSRIYINWNIDAHNIAIFVCKRSKKAFNIPQTSGIYLAPWTVQ